MAQPEAAALRGPLSDGAGADAVDRPDGLTTGYLMSIAAQLQPSQIATLLVAFVGFQNVELLIEHHQEGRPQIDLARRLGVSPQAVHKRLAAAKRKLVSAGAWPDHWR